MFPSFGKRLVLFLACVLLLAVAPAAFADTTVVYDATSAPLPPNMRSLGFQATQTSEFGDYVRLAGTNRELRNVTVTMSAWALNSQFPSMSSAGWNHPITLNIYSVAPGAPNTVVSLLGTKTQVFTIPWRPEADTTCTGGTAWRATDGNCYNGFAFNIMFDMSSLNLTLPDDIVVGVAYNTNTWGAHPIGAPGPYESLNVGLEGSVTFGTDVEPGSVFWSTMTAAWYFDGGAAGVGIFREDANWAPYVLPIQITAEGPCTTACYVDAALGSDANLGTSGSPFKTIQKGVDTVAASGTVNVAAGSYAENVLIEKAVIISGPNNAVAGSGARGLEAAVTGQFKINANDVTLTGLKVLEGGQQVATELSGVHIVGGHSNVTIENNRFERSGTLDTDGSRGVINEYGGTTNLRVEGNFFTGWHTGVYLQNANAQVLNNVMQDNMVGMSTDGPVNVFVQGNEFTGNDLEGMGIGGPIGALTVTLNKFSGNLTALANYDAALADAEKNWWGNDSGPGPVGPSSGGDPVSTNVDFQPWCNSDFSDCTLPWPHLAPVTSDALFCTNETTDVFIGLSNVVDLSGYQFEVSYDATKASATAVFEKGLFDTTTSAFVQWNADCITTPGTCKFAVAKTGSATPASGTGPLAKITLTGVAPGTFEMAISDDVLSDKDGAALAHTLGADLPISVCGYATISGFVTLQGRTGPLGIVDAGTVSMLEQSPTSFSDVTPVPFTPSNGAYSIVVPYLPGGSSYKIVAEHGLYLDNADTITVLGNLANKNTRLWGGDADLDGNVKINDLSCIGSNFGGTLPILCGTPGIVDSSPDINADGKVNVQDLSIAGGNFDKCGAQPWAWNTATPLMCPSP